MDKKKLIGLGVGILILIIVLVFASYVYLPVIRTSISVMRLTDHPATESLSIVLSGNATNIEKDGFNLVAEGKEIFINTDQQTAFWSSTGDNGLPGSVQSVYQLGDIKDNQTVKVSGVILDGGVWANAIVVE